VTLAASLGWKFATVQNAQVSFQAVGGKTGDVNDFLAYLATVDPRVSASPLDGLEISDGYNIVLTARARETIPANVWANSYVIFIGSRE
jgi:hypothetical protein